MAKVLACCMIIFFIGTDAVLGETSTSSRLVEKEINMSVAGVPDRISAGLEKPLSLSGYFKVRKV